MDLKYRASANKIIRTLAYYLKISVAESFNTVYNELLYKYHINLKQRGGKPYIQNLKDDEWIYLYKVVAAICEINNIDISKLFSKAKINIKELCL